MDEKKYYAVWKHRDSPTVWRSKATFTLERVREWVKNMDARFPRDEHSYEEAQK